MQDAAFFFFFFFFGPSGDRLFLMWFSTLAFCSGTCPCFKSVRDLLDERKEIHDIVLHQIKSKGIRDIGHRVNGSASLANNGEGDELLRHGTNGFFFF